MEEIKREELKELKKYFVNNGWVDGLFQILFLLEDAKPGVYLQEIERKKLKQLRNMLYWFKLYMSMRHGGYTTKRKELYKEWNRIFGFKLDAEKFLGYPRCCVVVNNLFGGNVIFAVHLYSLIKEVKFREKSRQNLQQFLINLKFLHHHPCKSNCVRSIYLEREFESIARKYHWLIGELLPDFDRRKIKGLIQTLEFLPTQLPYDKLRKSNLLSQLGLNPNDVREIVENKKDFKKNLEYGKQILISFL